MCDNAWTRSGLAWAERFGSGRLPLLPAAPTLDSNPDDSRPIAGRILNPRGEVIKIVRHGPDKPPFGFRTNT